MLQKVFISKTGNDSKKITALKECKNIWKFSVKLLRLLEFELLIYKNMFVFFIQQNSIGFNLMVSYLIWKTKKQSFNDRCSK